MKGSIKLRRFRIWLKKCSIKFSLLHANVLLSRIPQDEATEELLTKIALPEIGL